MWWQESSSDTKTQIPKQKNQIFTLQRSLNEGKDWKTKKNALFPRSSRHVT
jgi:zona occludens toxin (predicted ATPase)